MNTWEFAGTKRPVDHDRHYNTEISPNGAAGFIAGEIEGIESRYEIYGNDKVLKRSNQPFNVFKTISRDDYQKWDTGFLMEFIVKTHHEFAKNNAAIIYSLAQKVAYRHCENHPELRTLIKGIFLFFHDLLNELRQEESFFDWIRQAEREKEHRHIPDHADSKSLRNTIKGFQNNQGKSLNYLKVIRQITSNFKIPGDACHSYESLLEKLQEFEEFLTVHFYPERDIIFLKLLAFDHKNAERDRNIGYSGDNG